MPEASTMDMLDGLTMLAVALLQLHAWLSNNYNMRGWNVSPSNGEQICKASAHMKFGNNCKRAREDLEQCHDCP